MFVLESDYTVETDNMDSLRMCYRSLRERIKRLKKEATLSAAVKKILPHQS